VECDGQQVAAHVAVTDRETSKADPTRNIETKYQDIEVRLSAESETAESEAVKIDLQRELRHVWNAERKTGMFHSNVVATEVLVTHLETDLKDED
jgi:hypothetical protein